ncbi:MAG: response regulator [Chloroflexi bacterium]|nr:response regulator [Chloroflexota bacterium]
MADIRKKVLLIDDELDFVDALSRTLETKNYQVVTTSSGQIQDVHEAMKCEPDIVVLGTCGPAGSAFRLHQWLKGHPAYKSKPMIVIDARDEERAAKGWRREEGMQLEAEFYVSKPVEPAWLVPKIQALVEEATKTIRILVTDDHTMVRDGICAVLALQRDLAVVGEAVNGQEAIEKTRRLQPNVVLMDIVMPVMSGLEATKRIVKEYPDIRVLILTQYDDEENMFVAKQAGAHGFIAKKAASSDLLNGIRAVGSGRFFPPAFAYVTANWKEGETKGAVG